MRAVVVSHWDVDGIAAAAIAVRMGAERYRLASTTALPRILAQAVNDLERLGADTLIVADLNPSDWQRVTVETALDYAMSLGARVLWVDHHRWSERIAGEVAGMGVELVVDEGRVSAQLMAERLGCRDGVCTRLIQMAIDDDLFLGRDGLARRWRRLLRWYGWSVRRRAVGEWARGRLWPEWAARLWEGMRDEYENMLERVALNAAVLAREGLRIVAVRVPDDRLHPGEVHAELVRNGFDGDIYALIYGGGVSLRSETIPLTCIARRLGGGGHERAAGIPGSEWTPEALADKLLEAIRVCGLNPRREEAIQTIAV